jgi:hypothetical protein
MESDEGVFPLIFVAKVLCINDLGPHLWFLLTSKGGRLTMSGNDKL